VTPALYRLLQLADTVPESTLRSGFLRKFHLTVRIYQDIIRICDTIFECSGLETYVFLFVFCIALRIYGKSCCVYMLILTGQRFYIVIFTSFCVEYKMAGFTYKK